MHLVSSHISFENMEKIYTDYYLSQIGGGLNDIGPLYVSPRYYQQGRGVGSFLGGIFKYLKPLLYSGLEAIKKQTLKAGVNVLNDIGKRPFKDILKQQGKQAVDELTEKGMRKLQKLSEQSGNGTSYSFNFPNKRLQSILDQSQRSGRQLLAARKPKRITRKVKKAKKNKSKRKLKIKNRDIFN